MPTKHIDDATWHKVTKITIDAVLSTKEHFKESEVLKMLIEKGIKEINENDFEKVANEKRKKR